MQVFFTWNQEHLATTLTFLLAANHERLSLKDAALWQWGDKAAPPQREHTSWASILLDRISSVWKEWSCLDSPDNYARQKASRRVTSCHWHSTKELVQSVCGSQWHVLVSSAVCKRNWCPAAAFLNPALNSQLLTNPSQWLITKGTPLQVHFCELGCCC